MAPILNVAVPFADGPLTPSHIRYTAKVDEAGEINVELVGADPRTSLLRVQTETEIMDGMIQYGAGRIDSITQQADPAQGIPMQVRGPSRLVELSDRLVKIAAVGTQALPVSVASAVAAVMAFAPAGWTVDTTSYPSSGATIFLEFSGETVLDALAKIAEQKGEHFREEYPARTVTWLSKGHAHSTITATRYGGDTADTCLILGEPEYAESSADMINCIYGYGTGTGTARMTPNSGTWTPPDSNYVFGTDSAGTMYLAYTPSYSVYSIERQIPYKDISSADELRKAMYEDLQRRVQPARRFALTVAHLRKPLGPGDLIRLTDRITIEGYRSIDIDQDLIVMSTTREVDSENTDTVALTLSTVDRTEGDENSAFVRLATKVASLEAHDQPVSRAISAATLTGTVAGLTTAGAIPFVGTTGQLTQDAANLAYEDIGDRLTTYRLRVLAGTAFLPVTKTAAYTLGVTETVVLANATAGAFTLTLPSATGLDGRLYIISRISAAANNVTVAAAAGQTINGLATYVLSTVYAVVRLYAIGTGWVIL